MAGNCCDWRVGQELPAMLRLNLGGKTIGVTHGWGDRPSLPARPSQPPLAVWRAKT